MNWTARVEQLLAEVQSLDLHDSQSMKSSIHLRRTSPILEALEHLQLWQHRVQDSSQLCLRETKQATKEHDESTESSRGLYLSAEADSDETDVFVEVELDHIGQFGDPFEFGIAHGVRASRNEDCIEGLRLFYRRPLIIITLYQVKQGLKTHSTY